MKTYADTAFLVSLYLNEATTSAANAAMQCISHPLPLIPLAYLELRNALHLAVFRRQITESTRAAAWRRVELDLRSGIYFRTSLAESELYAKAAELAGRLTLVCGTRTLDLQHLAAAILLGAEELLSFDEGQRRAAKAEGLEVKP